MTVLAPVLDRVRARAVAGMEPRAQLLATQRSAAAVDRWLRRYYGDEWDDARGLEPEPQVPAEPNPIRGYARGSEPRPALVTTSNNVAAGTAAYLPGLDLARLREVTAVALGGAARAARERESRRERYRLRAVHQSLLSVETRERPERVHKIRRAEDSVVWQRVPGGVQHVRLSQLLCGRAAAINPPHKGAAAPKGSGIERAAAVEIRRAPDGRAGASGLYYCGNVWSCPVCSWHIARERCEEVQAVHRELCEPGAGPRCRAYMLHLTVRHGARMPLAETRAAVADTWRQIRQLRAWKSWCDRLGYYGDVRALEVTHGAHGWHPHLHVVLWTVREIPGALGREFVAWLRAEWRKRIGERLGVEPNDERGVRMEPVRSRADYLAKLGIGAELAAGHGKAARAEGSRTTWELLRDVGAVIRTDPTHRDVALWREWVETMHGARQLTWGGRCRPLRKAMGAVEVSDEEAASADAARGVTVARIPVDLWTDLRRRLPGWEPAVLEAAEAGGGQAVALLVRRADDWYRGDGTGAVPTGPPPWWRADNFTP